MNHTCKIHAHLNEFSLIEKYFTNQKVFRTDVLLGVGDDAALVTIPSNHQLVLTMDTLIEGIHFPTHTSPCDIGYKALAVNLSDLAAMGADPAWITLALTIPEVNSTWLDDFANGLFQLANEFNVQLIGGDTTRGKLSITIQAHGFVPTNQALRRDGAKVGDKIYVSGTLGDAGLGLRVARDNFDLPFDDKILVLQKLNRPAAKIKLGIMLRELANSAIDISDGLLADLNHILERSHVGARINANDIPLSKALLNLPREEALKLALTAGDDYELCFTVSPECEKLLPMNCYYIGEIVEGNQLQISGYTGDTSGYKHF